MTAGVRRLLCEYPVSLLTHEPGLPQSGCAAERSPSGDRRPEATAGEGAGAGPRAPDAELGALATMEDVQGTPGLLGSPPGRREGDKWGHTSCSTDYQAQRLLLNLPFRWKLECYNATSEIVAPNLCNSLHSPVPRLSIACGVCVVGLCCMSYVKPRRFCVLGGHHKRSAAAPPALGFLSCDPLTHAPFRCPLCPGAQSVTSLCTRPCACFGLLSWGWSDGVEGKEPSEGDEHAPARWLTS